MSILVAAGTLILLAAVILFISAPLRVARGREEPLSFEADQLEAAREAKYREIRDVEMDYRTGKLSRADYEAVDGVLRGEALEILNRLQARERDVSQAPTPPDQSPD